MAKPEHVFVSYRSTEADLPLKIAADLKIAGMKIWMDRLDGILVGDNWRKAIQKALKDSSALIAVVSPDYLTSKYCQKELELADDLNLPIYPILLHPVPKEDMPLVLVGDHYEDFTNWRKEEEYAKRFAKLLQRLQDKQPALIGDKPDPETAYLIRLIEDLESYKGVLEYVEPSAQASGLERPDPRREGWPQEFSFLMPENQQAQPIDVDIEQVEKRYKRFVLIGDPGGGKTTTLRRLASQAARKRLENPVTTPLPMYISLPAWRDETAPFDLVRSHYPFNADSLIGMLVRGDIWLYFDGLNEMGESGKKKVQQLKTWLQSDAAPQHAIFTCRAKDYKGDLDLDLPAIQIEPLNTEQIKVLVHNYLEGQATDFLSHILPATHEEKEDNRHLYHLAHNPYMLASLIYIFQKSSAGDLPRNQGRLFRQLVQTLWEREHEKQSFGKIPFKEAESAFGRLAFAIIDRDDSTTVNIEYALKHLSPKRSWVGSRKSTAESLLIMGESTGWIQIDDDTLRFSHQLLREYFAAIEMKIVGLAFWKNYKKHNIGSPPNTLYKWNDVIIAMSGLSSSTKEADKVIQQIADIDKYFVLNCIASAIDISPSVRNQIIESGLHGMTPMAIADYGQMLGENAKGTIAVSRIIESSMDWDDLVRQKVANALGKIKDRKGIDCLLRLLNDENEFTRVAAADALGEMRVFEPLVVDALYIGMSDPYYNRVRKACADALQKMGWQPDGIVDEVIYAIAAEDWAKCISLGTESVVQLFTFIGGRSLNPATNPILEVLIQIGESSIPYLVEKLEDKQAMIGYSGRHTIRACEYAAKALKEIGTSEAIAAIEEWKRKQQ